MTKFKSPIGYTSIAQGVASIVADASGIFELMAHQVATFQDLIAAGALVPVVDEPAAPLDLDALGQAVDDADAKVNAAHARLDKATTAAAKRAAQTALDKAAGVATAAHEAYDAAVEAQGQGQPAS